VSSDVKARLFRAYCTIYCRYDLRICQAAVCLLFARRGAKSIRRIWNLPYRTHCRLLTLLCNCMPMFDEICRRSLKFLQSCRFIIHACLLCYPVFFD